MDLNSRTLKIHENLNISNVEIPEIPPDIIYPEELNRFLREQIRYYAHENGMVRKNYSDMELKYNECKMKMDNLETKLKDYEKLSDGCDMLTSSKVASTKIVQLSKKLREKNSEVEMLKTKNSKLEQYIYELTKKAEDIKETVTSKEEKPPNEIEETIKKLQDKLNYTSNKLLEVKNANSQLKNDLKIANKWLQQEIGESFESLQSLSNSNNGSFRGRAQIICDLQQKNSELKAKLKELQEKFGKSATAAIATKTDNKINMLTKENNELKQMHEEIKKKYDASRARCRVLDSEYTLVKSKCAMMTQEAERAQDTLSTITAQISNSREQKNASIRQLSQALKCAHGEKETIYKELNEYKSIVKCLKDELNAKNKEIHDLKNSQQPSGIGPNEERNISRLNAERLKLTELVEVQNNRLKIERDAHSKTKQLLRFEKQRSAKAEANVARVLLESNTSRSSSYSNASSIRSLDFGLKDQLELAEENIKALKTRLEMEQFERKADIQEFTKILQLYENKN